MEVLKRFTRIPNGFKKRVRREQKATFILKNKKSFRLIFDKKHLLFLNQFLALYSSSANITSKDFCLKWAQEVSDIWIIDSREFEQKYPSTIYKISEKRLKKIR
ncbi:MULTISPECIES: Sua5 YciO YrdC YwlC family protein [unclassified Helicobacter]|uniref:Sua5 YciO YrdC YwlC family protein n=1 Tax=unclassified Helicobacter TaxID=2593540 RepID=UPI0018F832E0|nr:MULTISPECIES: Sua5 YciO YrdC YwlC family protein [unclassified Helicobacter]